MASIVLESWYRMKRRESEKRRLKARRDRTGRGGMRGLMYHARGAVMPKRTTAQIMMAVKVPVLVLEQRRKMGNCPSITAL